MPQNGPIVVADGKATPANHTFNPRGIGLDGNVARFVEVTSAGLGQQPSLSVSVRQPTAKSRMAKVECVLTIPNVVEAQVNGVPVSQVMSTAVGRVSFSIPSGLVAADRKDLRVMISNLLKEAKVADVIDNVESFW